MAMLKLDSNQQEQQQQQQQQTENNNKNNNNNNNDNIEQAQDDLSLKILVIGEAACGKTSIIHKYCLNKFEPKYKVTMGLDFFPKKITVDDQPINLALWDVAGQERFHHMIRSYFKNANGAIIVFDLTRIYHTLNSASKWKLQLDICFPDDNPIPCILLANKSDLFDMNDVEIKKQLDEFIAENGIKQWFFTSAKEGFGIEHAMEYIARVILDTTSAQSNTMSTASNGSFQISSNVSSSNVNTNNNNDNSNNNNTKGRKCCAN
ncbi:hypothetical protein PPL_07870 [Heterostelium album PN500]|uniref:Uncharacterized protein n=1 Tax=Heterostelium pallidum (strain ATCC 26659 / Pp 5 / PN500) TaxID=670386 RepID=D3BH68_HETP5|nr:hypothetical protein PPL_07870 [Heterostelium album PN500]EFA79452.1 hypothetical protein PPL_07870 [Heterostelium album PN500]|eukprot:XP_020431573.1 hypothetical protein PPL_07870 [Heterostelium album PN500]